MEKAIGMSHCLLHRHPCRAHYDTTERLRSKGSSLRPGKATIEALSVVASVLGEVAEATQDVPYIQALSSVITHLMKINEVRSFSFVYRCLY